ncbi:MAG: HAD family hydrolase [Opitutaceae bacterium]|nr:HAD family hydrolase [Opitutaceae bacterium]
MILLLFDLDNTLVDTLADDARYYGAALDEVAGQPVPLHSWEHYSEITASAIAREALAPVLGRRTRDGEVYRVREIQTRLWEKAFEAGELTIRPVPGALELFAEARQRKGCVAAIATGGWGPSALIKLHAAGFPLDDLVIATSDDAESRQGILGTAEVLAAAARGCFGFSGRVVIGDGIWDARGARAVKGGFIGVSADPVHALQLRAEGATAVLSDFTDRAAFWAAVDAAVRRGSSAPGN